MVAGAAIFASSMPSDAEVVRTFHLYGPQKVRKPLIVDSVNAQGAKYDVSNLLSGAFRSTMDARNIEADSKGLVAVQNPAEGLSLYSMQAGLRAARYAKGKLKITTPARFELFVDKASKLKKTTAEDSISDASARDVEIELQPEKLTELEIRILTDYADKATPEVKVEFIPDAKFEDVAVLAGSNVRDRVSLRTTVEGPRVSGTVVSPDGKYYITYYSEVFAPVTRWATLSETATGKIINANLQTDMRWMPSGSTLYYTRESKKGGYDIITFNPATGASSTFASCVPSDSFTWSPDLSYIIYYDYSEGKKEEGVLRRYTSPDDRIVGNRARYNLQKYDFATGLETTLTYGNKNVTLAAISPDSKDLLIVTRTEMPEKYPFYKGNLLKMNAQTLKTDTLISDSGESTLSAAVYSPDGKRVFIVSAPSFANNLGFNAGNHEIANDFDMQGYIMDMATGKITPVTKDFDPSIEGTPVWSKDGNIYFRAVEGFNVNLFAFNPSKNVIRKLDTKIDNIGGFSMGKDETQWISYNGQGYEYIGRAYMLNLSKNTNRQIDDPMAEMLSKIDMGKTEPWNFVNSKGDTIEGVICTPPDFDPAKKYPLIVYYYGGTTPSNASMSHPYSAELFASRDYVVYIVNPSGTIGYGQEFSARHVNAWGKQTAQDIIEGVKAFCKAHPFVNDKKIGCLGASYGGFMTQYLLTQTDIFAAAMSHAGISNVTSYWGEGYWGYSYNAVAAAKSYPWTNPELFTKQGSLFNADKIHTPLLLMHGTADTNVPIGESIQLFNALKLLNRTVEFISVDAQNHFISDFPHRDLWHATIMAWFAKWLQDDPRWWDSMYGK